MKRILTYCLVFLITSYAAYAYEPCDTVRTCTGNALLLSNSTGNKLHYVDITRNASLLQMSDGFTFEMWMKMEKQAGMYQFIAGDWGPGFDRNDSWVIYVTPADSLVFELNHPDYDLKEEDNTRAVADASGIFDTWIHLAAVFDPLTQTAFLYLNGLEVAQGRNDLYPISKLNVITNTKLPIQIGSCNGVLDNSNYRTYLGFMDEIRIWARPFTAEEIMCEKDRWQTGAEQDLILYYRCNEKPSLYRLCDASGSGNFGQARSGAHCENGGRPVSRYYDLSVKEIIDTLKCVTTKSWQLTLTNNSTCTSGYYFRFYGDDSLSYTAVPDNFDISPGETVNITLSVDNSFTGELNSSFRLYPYRPYNACGSYFQIPIKLTRITELDYSSRTIEYDSVIAGCEEMPYIDSILTISNNTVQMGNPRPIEIRNISNNLPQVFNLLHNSLPVTLDPGESFDVTVRFNTGKVSADYFDTIRVESDDQCPGSGMIPMHASSRELISITKRSDGERIDTLDFGTICKDYASDPLEYYWENIYSEDIQVEDIIFPKNFTGSRFKYPVILEPNTGYLPNYFRFVPEEDGVFLDSIIIRISVAGCTVNRIIYVKASGFLADVDFVDVSADFGDVVVGQETVLNITAKNNSDEDLRVSFYMTRGEVFFITGARIINIPANGTASTSLTFIPTQAIDYRDNICLQELRCYSKNCIPVTGRGILEEFAFEPDIMETKNVIGCQTALDTLDIVNNSSTSQTLTNFILDPGDRYRLINPPAFPASVNLAPGEKLRFIFEYNPNDSYTGRKDREYLRYNAAGKDWLSVLIGTSVVPTILITEQRIYGTVEVGDTHIDSVLIENSSAFPIKIDSIIPPEGFRVLYPGSQNLNIWLDPVDSIHAQIAFEPDRVKDFSGWLNVYSSMPCITDNSGWLAGIGQIIPLEVPQSLISFGYTRPCDCEERELLLINGSEVFDMTIDSVVIDGSGLQNAAPEYFKWTYSTNSPSASVPYDIPPWSYDTLRLTYCPRSIAHPDSVDHEARVTVYGHGQGWQEKYETYLTGKRTLVFMPSAEGIVFPPTPVDAFANPRSIDITIPGALLNPDGSTVVIDSITFVTDERVFSIASPDFSTSQVIDTSADLEITVNFKPRFVRPYLARMNIHMSTPCQDIDTTVFVYGSGFAPAYGLDFNFENNRISLDTLQTVYCDTLEVPVFVSRNFPAEVVDIKCRIGYDDTKLQFAEAVSEYLADTCSGHVPEIFNSVSAYGGTEFLLKNFCFVDSVKPVFTAKFVPLSGGRDNFKIYVDSLKFDTEEVILYEIVAETDSAHVVVLQPEYEVLNDLDFGTVQVLGCNEQTLSIVNTGDVPMIIDQFLNLPEDIAVTASIPPAGDYLPVGDTAAITLRFCPRKKQEHDIDLAVESSEPCALTEETLLEAIGYAPEHRFYVDVSDNYLSTDQIVAAIGDTVAIPVYISEDFGAEIDSVWYWLEDMRFKLYFEYNKFELKYLDSQNLTNAALNAASSPGKLTLDFDGADSVSAGQVAEMTFLVLVPDSVQSDIFLSGDSFETDSIMFLDLIALPTRSELIINGQCKLTYLIYNGTEPQLFQNAPNPWSSTTEIKFITQEKANIVLKLYSANGELVSELLDGSATFPPGEYLLELNSGELESGMYFYEITAGTFAQRKKMILIK